MTEKNRNHDTVDFSPKKEDMYRAIMADVDVAEAVLEITDNAIDNWERVSDKTDPMTIEIFTRTTDDGETEFVIRDDSGGIRRDELQMLFGVGHSARDEIEGSVGAYGVGAKRAILRLADEATIATRYKSGTEEGYGFTVDKEWLSEDTWERPVESFDIQEGRTEIRLRNLNFQPESKIDDIREELRQAYEIFLGGGPQHSDRTGIDYDFVVRVEGDAIEQPDPVNWSFTPYDDLFPRQFQNIKLDSKETENPVYLDVTVGLLQTAKADDAGTDVYLQNRKVHDAAKDEQGGFGGPNQLDSWSSQQKRLKIIVELHTDGDSRDLPWNSSKTGLDTDSEITQQAFDWVRRTADRYYDAVYGTVPQRYLRPYGRGSEYAAPGRLGENGLDYEGRQKVTDKPKKDFPDIDSMQDRARAHARLGIIYTDDIKDEYVPGYEEDLRYRLQDNYSDLFGTDHDPVEIDRGLPITLDEVGEHVEQLDMWARADAKNRQRYTDLDEWERPRYEATLRSELGKDVDIDDLDEIDTREDSGESDKLDIDTEETETDSDTGQIELTDDQDDGDDVEPETTTMDTGQSLDTSDTTTTSGTDDTGTEDGSGGTDDGGDSQFEISQQDDDDEPTFNIVLTPEQQEVFEEVLGIDDFEKASPEKRGEALADRMEQLNAVLEAATPQGD